ncbi:hypothetical protein T4D_1506 [Trichinella pseudospiralis]|uniref:Uncharacterized protein n=1 Tax=Trichinella pseudospiralis TaxID=6337 RepID=A0A0V1FN66_TRIPS|nr:hypothetical protein T4D_1506 [Trichinella pseudospiralis]
MNKICCLMYAVCMLNYNNLLDLKCTAIWKRNGDIGNIYMYLHNVKVLRSWMQKLNVVIPAVLRSCI